jgi:ABC-type enterochelin transport system permease subunit
VKKPLRDPKIDHEWRTTFILASVAALLSVAVAIEAAVRFFWIRAAEGEDKEEARTLD